MEAKVSLCAAANNTWARGDCPYGYLQACRAAMHARKYTCGQCAGAHEILDMGAKVHYSYLSSSLCVGYIFATRLNRPKISVV